MENKILIFMLGMILLIGSISAIEVTDDIVINGTTYNFLTQESYCGTLMKDAICGEREYQEYKDGEVAITEQSKARERAILNPVTTSSEIDTTSDKGGLFGISDMFNWILDMIKKVMQKTETHDSEIDKMKAETCARDRTYSWCDSVVVGA